MDEQGPPDEDFRPARARIQAEIAAALSELDDAPDGDTGFWRSTWVTEVYRQATIAASEKRAGFLARVRDAGKLSLAALGDRYGLSKGRMGQLVPSGKRKDPPA